MAERERQRAHHADPARDGDEGRRVTGDEIRPGGLNRQELETLERNGRQCITVQTCPSPSSRMPLLPRAEVVDEAEMDVGHPRPVRDGDREGEERDTALRVDRAVDRIDDYVRGSVAGRPASALPGDG